MISGAFFDGCECRHAIDVQVDLDLSGAQGLGENSVFFRLTTAPRP